MKKIIFMLFFFCISLAAAKNFTGTATIEIINPTDTVLAICTNNNKYLMEPGNTYDVQFCVRNHEAQKTVKRVYMKAIPDGNISVRYEPMFLENIPPDEDDCFIMYFTVPKDTPHGNYEVNLLVGTDEHPLGAYRDIMLIKVRSYGDELYLLYGAIVIIIMIVLIIRFAWIRKVNKKRTMKKTRQVIHKKNHNKKNQKQRKSINRRAKT